jgi:uncharacterized protein
MPTPGQIALLVAVALIAGVVDAIAGGGGLVTVPVLLAVGLPPHVALATNKGQSVFGSGAALVRFARAGLIPWSRARWTFPLGFVGALAGAAAVLQVDPAVLRPVVLVLLVLAGAFVVLARPPEGERTVTPRALALAAGLALGIGFYDGFFGPGTGTFLVVGLAGVLALPLRQASAEAKVVNFGSNLAAMLVFASRGTVLWRVALPMAVAQLLGGWIGAHLTVRGSDRRVRWVVVAVVLGLVVKLGADWARS